MAESCDTTVTVTSRLAGCPKVNWTINFIGLSRVSYFLKPGEFVKGGDGDPSIYSERVSHLHTWVHLWFGRLTPSLRGGGIDGIGGMGLTGDD